MFDLVTGRSRPGGRKSGFLSGAAFFFRGDGTPIGGDTTPPTITSANPSGSYAEMAAVGGTLTADETVTWLKSGTDAARVTLDSSTGVWTLESTDFETKTSYSWSFIARDASNNPATQNVAIVITDVDEVPDAFAFADVNGAAVSTQFTSNQIVVSGLAAGVSVPVAVSGGSYSKNGGNYVTGPTTAQNGDTFTVRQTSSASNSTTTDVILNIGGVTDTYTVTTIAADLPSVILRGRTVNYSSGTEFDYIVDGLRGDDTTGDGALATPFKTPIKALEVAVAAGGNKKIGLRADAGQVYTDIPPDCSTDGIEFHGYDTELAPWEASYTVTGFAACTSDDADVLAAKWPNCQKATFAKSNLSHTAYNAMLPTENGTVLDLAQMRRDVSDLFIQSDPRLFYSSLKGDDVTITPSNGSIATISHPSVLGNYTQTQLENAAVMLHISANKCAYSEILSATGSTLTLPTPNGYTKETKFGDAYALLNFGPAIEQGQYIWKDNVADDTVTLYVFPNDPANLANGIKVAAHPNILTFSGSDRNKVSNILFRYIAGDGTVANQAPVVFDDTTNGVFTQCAVEYFGYKHFAAVMGPGSGPVAVLKGQNNLVQYIDYKYGLNQFGPYFTNNSTVDYTASNNRMLNCYGYRVTVSPWRMYGQTLGLVGDSLFVDCGQDAHAGKGEMTQACDRSGMCRLEYISCDGYISIQNGSNIFIILSSVPAPEGVDDARAIVDQSNDNAGAARFNPSTNYCSLNLAPKPASNTGPGASILLTASATASKNTTMQWYAYGNVSHGLDTSPDPTKLLGSGYGVYSKAATSPQSSDTVVSDTDDIFYDDANGNWNTLPGSILTTKTSLDMTPMFSSLEGWFPGFNFRQTIDGYPVDALDPRVGPHGTHWPVQEDTTAPILSFPTPPTISGASAAVTVTTSERGGTIAWGRYTPGTEPPADRGDLVLQGLDKDGNPALSSGSVNVANAGVQPAFTVNGTTGETDALAVAHRDRNLNVSAVITTDLVFEAFTPTWVSFDGTHFLRRTAAPAGAQPSTRKMIAAITLSRSAAQLTAGVFNGLFAANGSSDSTPTWGTTSTGKLQLIQEKSDNTAFANLVVPQAAAMTADQRDLLLVCFDWDGTNGTLNGTLWNIAAGTQMGATASGTAVGDISLKFVNPYDIFRAAGTYERFMLWDNPNFAVPDARDPSLLALFMKDGALLDPSVARAALGVPLIDPDLGTGVNRGSGGDFVIT